MEAPVRARLLKRPRQPSLGGQQQQQEEHELDRASSALLSRRKYLKKTAKGKVLKVVKERYLRHDLSCGSAFCQLCPSLLAANDPHQHQPQPLDARGFQASELVPSGHYVVPDTNAFLHQMDLLTSPLLAQLPIVVLQTVLDEVQHRSLPLFNRLKQLVKDDERPVWVFWNEACRDSATVRNDGESPNDRNDRAIRQAISWYNAHLARSSSSLSSSTIKRPAAGAAAQHEPRQQPRTAPEVILISDDADNLAKAKRSGIKAYSVRTYVEGLKETSAALLDLIAATGLNSYEPAVGGDGDGRGSEPAQGAGKQPPAKKKLLYDDYLPLPTLLAGIKADRLVKGYFNANPFNYLEGTVNSRLYPKGGILIVGRKAINRSVHGDEVVVQVLPESQWRAPGASVREQEKELKNDDADSEAEDEAEADDGSEGDEDEQAGEDVAEGAGEKMVTGRIIGVAKRNWRPFVCHIDASSLQSTVPSSVAPQTVFAQPVDARLPRIRLRTRQAPQLLSQKLLVSIDRWDLRSRYPEGHFVRSLGQAESKAAEQESLLLEYDVPYRPFGKSILACLPKEGEDWVVPPKEDDPRGDWRGREDLRDMIICSIDPPGCQDIDDALHARPLPNGNIEAGVHIADVSHFVHSATPMDDEAASRGTTVYLVDQRIDMLPSLLGTNLCSLRPYVERLAFSAIWEMTPEAEIVNVRFFKSVIASKAAFTYAEAQKRVDDKSLDDPITVGIRLLNKLAKKLRAARMKAGALNLASPEVKINLQSPESSDPIDVEQKELLETNSLVEEFMLLANCSVAAKIQETFPQTAVLRRHGEPPKTNFENLDDLLLKTKGMHLDASSSGALARSLDTCVDPAEPAFNTLVRILATRCMLSAEYFCSGSVSRDAFLHYGLAAPIYTHFTSPIRRYADVLAHRQLSAAIGYTALHSSLSNKTHVERIMTNVNKRHRLAQQAGRASVEFYVGLALKGRSQKEGRTVEVREEAFVIRCFKNGVAVYVHKLGIEGLVTFDKDLHTFDPESFSLTLPASAAAAASSAVGQPIKLAVFDKVVVNVSVVKDKNTQRSKVAMALVEPVLSKDL